VARVIIANSEKTRRDIIERIGVPEERVRTVYLGVDPTRFRPATSHDRALARRALSWDDDRPRVAFVGALGDRRKGFDVVYQAWRRLSATPTWDCSLAVVGHGAELRRWREMARQDGIADRIEFLGYRQDVPTILAACDALVAPTRYEPYGLGVHEAICCGLPALVSRAAGVAERYPASLRALLLENPENPEELVRSLVAWRARAPEVKAETLSFSSSLRMRTWDDMCEDIVSVCEAFV